MKDTLASAIGQLIISKVPGTELDELTKSCLKSGTVGGVTIFKENVASQEQLMGLCDDIRRASWHQAFIAVDQEGGAVQRLEEIISPLPSMMALGRLNDPERVKLIIGLSGKQLRLLGFNCVFAPVLDVNTNPANPVIGTRSFGSNPQKVATLGAAVMRAYLEAGVLPVAKHFPGHGDTNLDSHLALPRLSHNRERLDKIELMPFADNMLMTPAMLVAHLWVSCLDEEELPATLSYNVSTRLLKDEMSFQNLVVSDDMLMKAITDKWGLAEACVRSLEAGVDLLLVLSNPEDAAMVHKAILEAVGSGRISEDRISSACRARNAALKKLPPHEESEKARRLASLKRSVAAAGELLTETSGTAVQLRGDPYQIFAGTEPIHIYIPESPRYRLDYAGALKAEMPQIGRRLIEHRYALSPSSVEIEALAQLQPERCILVTFRAAINRGQIELASRLRSCLNRLLIASDVPYDLDQIGAWENAAAVYDPSDLAVRSFAKLMAQQGAPFAGSRI